MMFLLVLILIAIIFPGLFRALFFLLGLSVLYAIGVAHFSPVPDLAGADSQQETSEDSQEAQYPESGPYSHLQGTQRSTGARMCLLNGRSWIVGECPPYNQYQR